MMIILLWGFIFLLALAVIFLIWLQFKNQADSSSDVRHQQQVEQKVLHLEEHLKDVGNYARLGQKDAGSARCAR